MWCHPGGRPYLHFLNEHLEKDVVPYMCGLCKTRHTSKPKLEEHKRTSKHLQALRGVRPLKRWSRGILLSYIVSKNPHSLNIMDASHPGSERADLKILCGEDWKRLWHGKGREKGQAIQKKKYGA